VVFSSPKRKKNGSRGRSRTDIIDSRKRLRGGKEERGDHLTGRMQKAPPRKERCPHIEEKKGTGGPLERRSRLGGRRCGGKKENRRSRIEWGGEKKEGGGLVPPREEKVGPPLLFREGDRRRGRNILLLHGRTLVLERGKARGWGPLREMRKKESILRTRTSLSRRLCGGEKKKKSGREASSHP